MPLDILFPWLTESFEQFRFTINNALGIVCLKRCNQWPFLIDAPPLPDPL
jgi:hypothetical protein